MPKKLPKEIDWHFDYSLYKDGKDFEETSEDNINEALSWLESYDKIPATIINDLRESLRIIRQTVRDLNSTDYLSIDYVCVNYCIDSRMGYINGVIDTLCDLNLIPYDVCDNLKNFFTQYRKGAGFII